MADSAKREKIAAARKKLKQFQKTGKGHKDHSHDPAPPKAKTQKRNNNNTSQNSDKSNASNINSSREDSYNADTIPGTDYSNTITNSVHRDTVIVKTHSINELVKVDNNSSIGSNRVKTVTAAGDRNPKLDTVTQSSERQHTDIRPTASTESLHQISRQINGILAESPVPYTAEDSQANITELETRNRELAALLAQHTQTNEQLNIQLLQLREHAIGVQTELQQERQNATSRLTKELGPLKEQLQVHIQTIGILVAEKTELQSHLGQSQKTSDQRLHEVEDQSNRLKTSRQRVADLERNLSSTNNSSQKFEQSSKESAKEIDRLKLDLYKLNKSHEELKQTSSESLEKLKVKTSESSALQQTFDEAQRRLEMAELYAQQLSSQNEQGKQSLQIVQQLQEERDTLAGQVQQYTETFQKVSAERDQMKDQYQQYMDQLHHQNTQLTSQVSSLTEEREGHVSRQHDLEAAVFELQRKLEDVDAEKSRVDMAAHTELVQEVHKLQAEYGELRNRHEAQIRDNAQLSRLLGEKEGRIVELEGWVDEMGEQEGDRAELLENIQSDKTALSRALTQNKDLKSQLAELQNGFVRMSNDNMELTTKLQTIEHSSRDLVINLSQQEDEILHIRETLTQKESALQTAQDNSVEANKVKLLHEQVQDRLRHYEAQAQLVETLQKELHSSQDMVDALTTQNSELRSMLIRVTDTRALNPDTDVENAQRDDVVGSLQGTISQLQVERSELLGNLSKHRELSDHLSVKVSDLEEEVVQRTTASTDNDRVTRKEHEQVKRVMEMIQDKYNRVMRDKADLSDKADQLEHIVLQLQGETDTIGEYISLYHHQRALLQQRELQKNDYISKLANDREELQDKLGELQVLVMQLMGEKDMLHSYNAESRRPLSPVIQPHVTNGKLPNTEEWPDYTSSDSDTESEVETIIGGQDGATNPSHATAVPTQSVIDSPSLTPTQTPSPHPHTTPIDNRSVEANSRTRADSSTGSLHSHLGEGQTATKILNLLNEIGHSNLVDCDTFSEQQFHPCKYCKGRLQIL